MISTVVTTSTVSTVAATTITSSLAIVGIIVLIALLVQKEMLSSSDSKRAKRITTAINIALPPMLIAFIFIVVTKVVQVLK